MLMMQYCARGTEAGLQSGTSRARAPGSSMSGDNVDRDSHMARAVTQNKKHNAHCINMFLKESHRWKRNRVLHFPHLKVKDIAS